MRNLAGHPECDAFIAGELALAGIELVRLDAPNKHEVNATIVGKLGPFRFTRAWYYWIVNGPMPLAAAKAMYEDPVGKKAVRVAGHCGCPPPEKPWIRWGMPDGELVIHDPDGTREAQWDAFSAEHPDLLEEKPRHAKDPAAIGADAYVDTYHVDTQDGLNLLAETIRGLR